MAADLAKIQRAKECINRLYPIGGRAVAGLNGSGPLEVPDSVPKNLLKISSSIISGQKQ